MNDVFWIRNGLLGGRPGPMRSSWDPRDLHAAGIRAVLNVSEHEDPTSECIHYGIAVSWIPLPLTVPPEEVDELGCLEALPKAHDFVAEHLALDNPVLVHCVVGRDRTGMVLAYHLAVTEDLSAKDAIARVRAVRPEALTASGWEDMAVRVIDRLRGEVHARSVAGQLARSTDAAPRRR